MTSWINHTAPVKPKKPTVSQYFQPTEGGFCSNFNHFIYSVIYAQKQGERLYVYDKPNAVSQNFPLLESILQGNANVIYLKEKPSGGTNLMHNIKETYPVLANIDIRRLRQLAQTTFWLNPETQQRIIENLQSKGIDRTVFDAGIHIRSGDKITTGEMNEVPISTYVEKLRLVQRNLNKKSLRIFVMTDNYKMFEELKAAGDPSWNYTTFATKTPYYENGHVQLKYNLLPEKERLSLFYQFLTELWVMQNTNNLVVSYSSNVGRFLHIMHRAPASMGFIVSVDVPKWSPF